MIFLFVYVIKSLLKFVTLGPERWAQSKSSHSLFQAPRWWWKVVI